MSYKIHIIFSMSKIFLFHMIKKNNLNDFPYQVFSKDNHTIWVKSRITSFNHTKKMDEYT